MHKYKYRPSICVTHDIYLLLFCSPVGISALADCMDCPELKVAADDFFQIHFTEVYKLDEFLQLDVAQLTHLLHQDKLTVRAEAQVRVYTSFKYICDKEDVCHQKFVNMFFCCVVLRFMMLQCAG